MSIRTLSAVLLLLGASPPSIAQRTDPDLDAIIARVIAQERVVGASVLVARGDQVILHK